MSTSIRGAITVTADTPENIREAVACLLETIVSTNNLEKKKITTIVFSSTSDIHSYYPAKAARDAGITRPALFSAVEPEITGALKRCIRVLLLVDETFYPRHVYLRGAANLRPDLEKRIVITLDGPAGSGKSTVAKRLAEYYNILYLDTGAMYRACALKVLKCGVNYEDEAAVSPIIRNIDLKIEYHAGKQHTVLDGEDVSAEIRKNEVSWMASKVSSYAAVREKMVEMQREVAKGMECVLDGRDIGSVVLPDAPYKFFVTADSRVRAKRRYDELTAKGEQHEFEAIHESILRRDEQDTTRAISPLVMAKDAVLLDTSAMDIDEVVGFIMDYIG